MNVEFSSDISLSPSEQSDLDKATLSSHNPLLFRKSVACFIRAASTKLCGLYLGSQLAAFAWYMPRTWAISGLEYLGLSIGLFTIIHPFRGNRLGEALLQAIEKHAKSTDVDFIYLQGIPNYYNRMGYSGFAPKSKFVFKRSSLAVSQGNTRSLLPCDMASLIKISEIYKNHIGSFARRSMLDWQDLVGPLSESFMFFNPRVIINERTETIGYYCSSPENPGKIREFVSLPCSDMALSAMSIIASELPCTQEDSLEIFAPIIGPIANLAERKIDADFIRFYRPRSSNMIKWLNSSDRLGCLENSFILQGDNL
jgi:hypothetical protein